MCAYMFLNILIKFQFALKFLFSTKNLFASSAKLLIAGIPCRCSYSIESSLWATKRSLGRVTDGEKSGCQYYWNGGCRLREQSAISASQSGALIGTAWYRIKLKGKLRVIARERERKRGRREWDEMRTEARFACTNLSADIRERWTMTLSRARRDPSLSLCARAWAKDDN